MKRGNLKWKLLAVLAALIAAGVYYYVALPAVNIHSKGFWGFLIGIVVVFLIVYSLRKKTTDVRELKSYLGFKIGAGIVGLLLVFLIVGTVLSSPIVNAKKYYNLVEQEERNFTEDIPQISFDQIPILDRDSAIILGERKMGSIVDMVSQFEVSDMYTQINYQNKPVRVTPLQYGSLIKWFTNHGDGIPAYIRIDMTTQEAECVRLEQKNPLFDERPFWQKHLQTSPV